MIQAIAVLYFKHKSLTDDYKKGELTDYIVDNTITNLIKDYHRACVDIIYMTPTYAHQVKLNARNAQGKQMLSARERLLASPLDLNSECLNFSN